MISGERTEILKSSAPRRTRANPFTDSRSHLACWLVSHRACRHGFLQVKVLRFAMEHDTTDWRDECWVNDDIGEAIGGVRNLKEILELFRRWVELQTSEPTSRFAPRFVEQGRASVGAVSNQGVYAVYNRGIQVAPFSGV